MIKKSVNIHINEIVNERIQNTIKADEIDDDNEVEEEIIVEGNLIETTEEEMSAYYIVKAISGATVESSRIYYKDTRSYFNILLDNKVTRWICRIYIKDNAKYVIIPKNDEQIRFDIETVDQLYSLSDAIIGRLNELLG